MAKKDKPLLVYLSAATHAHLRRLSEEQDVSMGHLIRRAVVAQYGIQTSTTPLTGRTKKTTK